MSLRCRIRTYALSGDAAPPFTPACVLRPRFGYQVTCRQTPSPSQSVGTIRPPSLLTARYSALPNPPGNGAAPAIGSYRTTRRAARRSGRASAWTRWQGPRVGTGGGGTTRRMPRSRCPGDACKRCDFYSAFTRRTNRALNRGVYISFSNSSMS